MSHEQNELGHSHLSRAAAEHEARRALETTREDLQRLLPDYELGECLGRGGMGAVFRAKQRSLDRPVAVKALLPPPSDLEDWGERFRREAQALARLQHPGIVTVHDYGQRGDLAWLVMELVEGASLRALLDEGRMLADEALTVVQAVCGALQYAHDRGVVHRDVKPENVLLDLDGRVKLVDFGLAKLTAQGEAPWTRADQAMGTPRYMAPEQLERPGEVDHRADIFSLGVVFYEMLTGQVPAGVVEPPSQKVDGDARLDAVVLRALQREPSRRYQSALSLKNSLPAAVSTRTDGDRLGALQPPQPVRGGWTMTELLALSVTPITAGLFANAIGAQVSETSIAQTASDLLPWALLSSFWLLLPIATTAISIAGRRRRLAVSMPLCRVTFCILCAVLALAAHAAVTDTTAASATIEAALTSAGLLQVILPVSLVAAIAGACSRRGAHRVLFSPSAVRALGAIAAVSAAVVIGLAALASFTHQIDAEAVTARDAPSLPFAAAFPTVLGAAACAALWRSERLRGALLCMAGGATLTLLAHTFAKVRYPGWSAVTTAAMLTSLTASLIAVAGTTRPIPRAVD